MFFSGNNKPIKRLLVMRFSAMGDVAMIVPVLHALATQNPDLRITMLTRTRFVPMFEWLPSNVQVRGIDFADGDGIVGLTKIYKKLKGGDFDAVADLHDVLRTKYLRTCFKINGTRVAVVNKCRKDRRALIGNGMTHKSLRSMPERYADVFRSLGMSVDLAKQMEIDLRGENFTPVRNVAGKKQQGERWIGIAPFAAHPQKIYPLDKMRQVAQMLAEQGNKVFLFGAGKTEQETLSSWEGKNITSICGKLGGLHNEMLLMSQLDLMISMDSANMHIASIVSTPVLSIWGATHPKAGFYGYGQSPKNLLQLGLECRPCSIYGSKPCQFGDLRCMNFKPENIVNKAAEIIAKADK